MKKLFLIVAILQVNNLLPAQIIIAGKLEMSPAWDRKMYLSSIDKFDIQTELIDSLNIAEDGSFRYRLEHPDPKRFAYRLLLPLPGGGPRSQVEGFADNYIYLILQDGDKVWLTAASDSLYYSYQVFESPNNKALTVYRDFRKPFYHLSKSAMEEMERFPDSINQIRERVMPVWMKQINIFRDQSRDYLESVKIPEVQLFGIYLLYLSGFGTLDSEYVSAFINLPTLQPYYLTENLRKFLSSEENNRMGKVLPDIKLVDPKLNLVLLSSLAKETTVLDFWASWCGPCRQANKTHLKEIYEQINKQKVTILSISMDEDLEKWKKALKNDKVKWPAFREPGDQKIASTLLGILGLPTYVVLDKERKVIFHTSSSFALKQFILDNHN